MSAATSPRLSVVTGGASGIGEAVVRRLAADGDRVVVLDIDAARARAVADEVGGVAISADVSDEASMRAAAREIDARCGRVSVLVNSAGLIQRPLPPESLDLSTWDRIVAADQRGTWLGCVVFGEAMARRGAGCIVNIASIAGMRSMPLHSYAPAKAAVISMTECLAAEWGRSGVRVNAVSPGYTLTPALQAAIDAGERDPATLTEASALGRMVLPSDIAHAIAFLCSDRAAAITGINLPVDAGWLVAPSWNTYGGLRPARR